MVSQVELPISLAFKCEVLVNSVKNDNLSELHNQRGKKGWCGSQSKELGRLEQDVAAGVIVLDICPVNYCHRKVISKDYASCQH